MAKATSRTRTSPKAKKIKTATRKSPKSASDTSATGQAPKPDYLQHLLTMTADECVDVYQARCMLKLLEHMASLGEREIILSTGCFVAMLSVIRDKLAFSARHIPIDDEDILERQE